jgi:uncharacterized protein
MANASKSSPPDARLPDPSDYVQDGAVLIGCSRQDRQLVPECIELKLANRHGLVTGATGTGKTVTLQVLAEGFSAAGVPVFAADIKGDLSGLAAAGEPRPNLVQRAEEIGLARYGNAAFPTAFWDVLGEQGHPVRATVQEMGPLLLSRLLELTEPQEGVLNIAFRWAADERKAGDAKMAILDLRDLRAVIDEMGKRASSLRSKYGNVAPATVGVIQRRLLVLEQQGADKFFGEPALDILDFIKLAPDGRGVVNILYAEKLMSAPRLYSTFLLWMLSELFERLPEVGDLEKPKLVFLFDEAHLLFNGARPAVLDQIERVTRLIRSKGVGVYYVTRLHAEGAEGGARRGADVPRQPRARHRARDPGAAGGRGAGVGAAQQGRAVGRAAHAGAAADVARRAVDREGAPGADRGRCRERPQVQGSARQRVGARAPAGAQFAGRAGERQAETLGQPVQLEPLTGPPARAAAAMDSVG